MKPQQPHFISVELEVTSVVSLTPLADALGKHTRVLNNAKFRRIHFASFGVHSAIRRNAPSLERMLAELCDYIEALLPAAKRAWKKARRRSFNVGIESGDMRPELVMCVSPNTLARVAACDASITTTVYPIWK